MTKQIKRQITTVVVDDIKWNLDGKTLDQAADYLNCLAKVHGASAVIDVQQGHDYCDMGLDVTREETDEEYNERMDKATALQSRTEREERAKLAELRKKYGE